MILVTFQAPATGASEVEQASCALGKRRPKARRWSKTAPMDAFYAATAAGDTGLLLMESSMCGHGRIAEIISGRRWDPCCCYTHLSLTYKP